VNLLFNEGWSFAMKEPFGFRPVDLPHDWLISNTQDLYETGTGFYKKVFRAGKAFMGKRVFLRFDGVMMNCRLFVNDIEVGEWKYGYTAFEFDIADFLVADSENTILLVVNYQSPCSRWYTGAGIYRDVFLSLKNPTHFVSDGIYITPRKQSNGDWIVAVDAEVELEVEHGGLAYEVRHSIVDAGGREVPVGYSPEIVSKPLVFAGSTRNLTSYTYNTGDCGSEAAMTDESQTYNNRESGACSVKDCKCLIITNARVWDINDPYLHYLKSELLIDGSVSDFVITRFGLRDIRFDPNEGFFLNGRRIKINGVCQHHDLGALGAAFNRDAARRQLNILRGMGVNAIRTAHNPPAQAFMELADEMGFLVMSEILDMWQLPKNKYDYARFFDDWIEKDTASWIRRDRNCPSVILWSIGNEIYDTHADFKTGSATLKMMLDLVKKHDPKVHAPATLSSNYMPWENTQKCADIVKIIGYNYAGELYFDHHQAHPDWVIYGGETGSLVQSRGVYHFPLRKELLHDDDMQCSALGNSRTSWGAQSIEKCITDDRDAYFSPGQFLWSGFDYIGEPTPYHTKNSYFGQIDTAGFPKDAYYIFKSAWTDHKTDPFVHVFPYWDFSPGQIVDVRICTNAPKAELFLNGKSLGVFEVDQKTSKQLVGNYQVQYEPGVLTGIAYDEAGTEIARTERRSFGDAASLDVKQETIGELVFYEISALDKDGNIVENANTRVDVSVEHGELLGMDNGDSTDYDQYQTTSRRMFNGKLLAIVKPDGLKNTTLNCSSSVDIEVDFEINKVDIPVRKIELSIDGFEVKAKTYPENASYNDLVWRLTDISGINSPLGSLKIAEDKCSAEVIPTGDGDVYIRCGVKNGGQHIVLYTQMQLTITGYGKPLLNPYSFITGGLFTHSNVELTNGNERGVATLRKGESHVGFADIDFGAFGSDEITLSLFPLSSAPFTFEIWSGGMPGHGGTLLCAPLYDKGSVWNTYQEVTYKMPRRLSNIDTVCFVFYEKVHIGGFKFTKQNKAFEKLYAAENDFIYGDSYDIKSRAIEGIGNNVTIGFTDMDFGDNGAKSIEINLRCKRKNSFQIINVSSDNTTISTMIEVEPVKDYTALCFDLKEVTKGKNTVSLVFLPGCNIDIEWIKFC